MKLKYVTHRNSEDGRETVVVLADESGLVHELLLNDVPTEQIRSECDRLAQLHHDINHWGYNPPECCHCLSFHAFMPYFCGLNHPMDSFRVYCATCPDLKKQVDTVPNREPEFFEVKDIDWSKVKTVEPKPPTPEEIEKIRRENHCLA